MSEDKKTIITQIKYLLIRYNKEFTQPFHYQYYKSWEYSDLISYRDKLKRKIKVKQFLLSKPDNNQLIAAILNCHAEIEGPDHGLTRNLFEESTQAHLIEYYKGLQHQLMKQEGDHDSKNE